MQKIIQRRSLPDSAADLASYPPLLQRVYLARGVREQQQLQYQLKHLLPPKMKGLEQATELLEQALQQQKKIVVVGDFDADGATSTCLALRCLRALGAEQVDFLVPNRFEFGYGLTPEIVAVAAQQNPDLIITVDNGISSWQGVDYAKQLGIQVLVTDHHLPGEQLPAADAIVNPNQHECDFASKAAAGVGVVFYVLLALRTRLRAKGWFSAQRPEPNLAEHLDLVALGTVADVVPLDYNNRILVDQGLKRMKAGMACPGIQALLEVAGRDYRSIAAADLGFAVGPRLNAAGRLDDMSLGIKCLLADDPGDALMLARELDALNRDRRAIERSMQVEAQQTLQAMDGELAGELPAGICLYRQDWHQGVIGILASRIKDKLHRPTIVFADDGQGALKGSGRSIPGLHLRDALDRVATAHPEILQKFGGHAMAAGLSLAPGDLPAFSKAFAQIVEAELGTKAPQAVIASDGALQVQEFDLQLAQQLAAGGPWGQAFPEPVFDGEFFLLQQKLVGTQHLKMVLALEKHASLLIDAIAFNVDVDQWPDPQCQKIKAAYKLSVNEFRGNCNLQLLVDYFEAL